MPSFAQAIRTSAKTGLPDRPPNEGNRQEVGSFSPFVDQSNLWWRTSTSNRKRNVGSISFDPTSSLALVGELKDVELKEVDIQQ